jgi:hypothetical protein
VKLENQIKKAEQRLNDARAELRKADIALEKAQAWQRDCAEVVSYKVRELALLKGGSQ